MADRPSTTPALAADNAGVFASNKTRPIHRWYPFIEGYSSGLVEWGLQVSDCERPRILDPFGGSGTTVLTAAEHSLDSWFCEVNPYLSWLTDVKVNQTQRIANHHQLEPLRALLELADAGNLPTASSSDGHPLLEVERKRAFFPEGTGQQVVNALAWLDQEADGPVREIGRAAVAVSLVPSSNMVRRTDLRRRTASDTRPRLFTVSLVSALRMILEDLGSNRPDFKGSAQQLAGDVRNLSAPKSLKFDLIITSPPYLNGTNYCRNTKLELLALGFIETEGGLSQYRTDSITAGINNVTKRRGDPEEIPEVEEVATRLDEVAYDKRIPTLVRLYFSDMRAALKTLRNSVTAHADLLLDIGDSKFAGVYVPTHELLAQIGAHVGWNHVETFPIRERRSYDATKLVQVVLRLRAQ